jgi:stage V sporulation protein R
MGNRGELLLRHRHEGIDLDVPFAEETLKNLYLIWGRPVHLETAVADEGAFLFSHGPDGGSHERI